MTSPNPKTSFLQTIVQKIGLGSAGTKRRIYLCEGPNCCRREEGAAAAKHLAEALKRHKLEGQVTAKRQRCFGVCGNGPIAAVYPDKVWYDEMNAKRIDRVVEQHFKNNKPVKEFTFEPAPDTRPPE